MKTKLLVVSMFLIIFSCSNNEKEILLKANNVNGLKENTKVNLNGLEIGKVKDIKFVKHYNLLVRLELDKDLKIPIDSKFYLENYGFLGEKEINIKIGNSEKYLLGGEVLELKTQDTNFKTDTLEKGIIDILDNLSGKKQKDSILEELKIINKKIDNLNKKN